MKKIMYYIPLDEIRRMRESIKDTFSLCPVLADIFRINALYMIQNAGSGHIGTSFSVIDMLTWIWVRRLHNPNNADYSSDIIFSSKGHDAPAFYALLIGMERLAFEKIHALRRIGGLPGHPDRMIPGMVTNTGSLGMGISKAKGMVSAKRLQGKLGNVYVICGDGELQEGQVWESLVSAKAEQMSELTVIIDHNKYQSDRLVSETSDLGNIKAKFEAFGWNAFEINGHDISALENVLWHAFYDQRKPGNPRVIIAHTVKGKGVSFMEDSSEDGWYQYHSGALTQERYEHAFAELFSALTQKTAALNMHPVAVRKRTAAVATSNSAKKQEKLVSAYGEELVSMARERGDIVALDADLVKDCGLVQFREEFPERYFQCGIAEQDMVSRAGGMALGGLLPVVHSFGCFLTLRPNEQIYNNATERTKIIYTGSLAGLIPAGPGHSHQSVRDIPLMTMPGMTIIQPANEQEARMAIRWAVEKNDESTYIRLVTVPCECPYELAPAYELEKGKGAMLKGGDDVAILAYGPVMLTEAWIAAEQAWREERISVAIFNMPWLNCIDGNWLRSVAFEDFSCVFVIDDHYCDTGLGERFMAEITRLYQKNIECPIVYTIGIEDIPACGTADEALRYHGLHADSIVQKIKKRYTER